MKITKTRRRYWLRRTCARNPRYIVVHTTGTRAADTNLKELDSLPYHYLVTRSGKPLRLKALNSTDGTIEIALVGGVDKKGKRVDDRTEQQNETLFNLLVKLGEQYHLAQIVGADSLYVYGHCNPGFDVKSWLASYIPAFLMST